MDGDVYLCAGLRYRLGLPVKLCVVTANCGTFENKTVDPVPQALPLGVEMAFVRYTDDNFPPRPKAMTPQLQSRIPKRFAWDMDFSKGYDVYLWHDSSCALLHPQSVAWFLDQMGLNDFACFKHPHRETVDQEYEFVRSKIAEGNKYLVSRYEHEDLDGQMEAIAKLTDDAIIYRTPGCPAPPPCPLLATTVLVYRNVAWVRDLLKEWWYHVSRFHCHDQLSLPALLDAAQDCELGLFNYYTVIEENYLKIPYLTYIRNR